MLLDTFSDLDKPNHGEYSKLLTWSMFITIFKDESISNGPRVMKMLWDTFSDLDNLNHVEYSKYQIY